MSQCDAHDCDNVSTMRYPVRIPGEYLFFCYECYMKWRTREGEEDAEVPMPNNES